MAHFNGKINNYFAHCADLSDLKREYHRLVMIHHPDVGGDKDAPPPCPVIHFRFMFSRLRFFHFFSGY